MEQERFDFDRCRPNSVTFGYNYLYEEDTKQISSGSTDHYFFVVLCINKSLAGHSL